MTRTTSENGRVQLTPTWRGVLPSLMWATQDGTDEGRRIAREELDRMALAASMAPEPFKGQALAEIIESLRGDCYAREGAAHLLARMAIAADAYNSSAPEVA